MGFQHGDVPAVPGRSKDTQERHLPLNLEVCYSPVSHAFRKSCQKKHYCTWMWNVHYL